MPSGAQTDIGYDRAGRIVYQASPLTVEATGSFLFHRLERRVTYDANGNVTSVAASDATGLDATRTTTTSYDDADRVVDVVTPTGSVTHTEYDDDSNVARLCEGGTAADPCGGDARVHEIGYTRRGEQETITLKNFARDPIGAPTSVFDLLLEHRRYDPAGRLAEITNARGKTTAFTYVEDRLPAKKILKGFRNPDGTTTRDVVLEENRYDEAGNLVEALSGNGTRRATNVVDAAGRVVSTIADPGGRNQVTTREFLVDDQPKRVSVSEAGRTESVEYTYNAAGSVETATVAGLVTRYTYDQRGLRTSATSPGGRVTRYFYDWLGQLVREEAPQVTTEEHGKPSATVTPTTTIGYNTFGEVVARRDARGQTTRYTYDLDGRPLATVFPTYTTPAGNQITPTESQTYDNLGNVATATDRRGAVTTNVYDRRGKLVRRTDPVAVAGRDAGVSRYSYDDGGNLVSAINQIGAGAAFIYDDRDRQVGTWQLERYPAPGAGTAILQSTLAYDDASNVTSTKDPTGLTMQFTYDGLDVRRSMTDPSGARWTYDVDVANRPVATTDPEGRRTAATYDLAGRKVRTEVFDTAGTSLAHETYNVDPDGLVVSVTDRRGHTSMTDYDALGRVTRTQTPKGGGALITQSFAYDAAGNRTRKTDGRGNATWTTYTPWNLPEKVIEPPTAAHPAEADRTWTKVYDPAGAEVSSTAPGNVNRQAAYDGLGRLVSTTGSGAEAPTTTKTFDYDAASRVTSISRPGGTINVTYNDRDKPVQVSDTFTTGYTYDAAGRLLSRTDQAGVANFTYDNRGKLRTASDPLTGATGTYSYRPAGQLDNVSYGSGKVVDQFAYDAFGRVQSETVKNGASTLASFAYEYDPNGNVTAKTVGPATAAGAGRHTYSYDEANRLTSWTAPGGAVTTYSWDDASNRTGAGSSTFTYDERNRLTSSTDASVTTSYSWSPRGTLASKRVGTGTPVTTAFDAFDRTVSDGSTTYTYDGLDRIRTAGSRTMGWSGLSKELASDGTTTYSQDALGLPVAQKTGGTASLLVSDAHGDIVGTAAPNGTALASSRSFDPWGKRTATVGSAQPSRGFQGDWTDPDTGRVDMNARLYDPATGIFTARDSLDPPEMGNRYGYTDANPLSMTDSTGHWPDFVDRAVGWVNNNVVQPVWNGVKTAASWVNDHVIQPVWNGIKAVASWINDHIIQPIWNGVQTAWNWTKNQVKRVVNRVVNTTKRVVSNVVDAATARYRAMVQATTRAYNQARTFVHSVQKTMVAKATNMAQAIAQVAKPVVATVHAIHTRANEVFADVSKQIQLLPARVEDAVRATRDFVAEQVVPAARNFVEGAGQWISEHRATIAAVGVFAGCALITGGIGSAGCAAAAAGTYGALSGFDAHCTNGQSFGECAVGVVGYAAVGAAAGYLAPIAGGLVGGQGVASTLLAGAIGGGTFGGINSAGIQLIDNRRIDAGRLAGDTAIGAAAGAVGAGLGGAIGRLRSTPPATRAPGSAGGGGSARGAGRPDGATVISGHGSYGNKAVLRVPKGTSVRTYTLHGSSITDELGNAIETGTRGNRIAYSHKFGSGEVIPDYTVHPPTGLNIQGNPITVTRSTQLSEILKPGMGECHLAFCLWEPGHPLSDAYMGLLPP